jgi:hypothetical protein
MSNDKNNALPYLWDRHSMWRSIEYSEYSGLITASIGLFPSTVSAQVKIPNGCVLTSRKRFTSWEEAEKWIETVIENNLNKISINDADINGPLWLEKKPKKQAKTP